MATSETSRSQVSVSVVGGALAVSLVGLLLSACGANGKQDGLQTRTGALTGLTPAFDWSVPDRLKVDATNTIVDVPVNPSTWPVNFTACGSTPAAGIASYRWSFGDGKETTSSRCDQVTHEYPSEGTYTVSLSVVATDNTTAVLTRDVVVQDFLIVALGDSYGSGEGSPNVEIPPNLFQDWLNLGLQIGDASQQILHAQAILAGIDQMMGPAEELANSINLQQAASCFSCLPSGLNDESFCLIACLATFPGPHCCAVCKSSCVALETGVTTASVHFTEVALQVATVQGLEFLASITNPVDVVEDVINQLTALKNTWVATLNTLNDTLQTLKGQRDIIPNLAAVKWQDTQCHRSSFSAQARAALALEAADPKSSVTFLHLACSGAETRHVYKDYYEGIDTSAGPPVPPQLQVAKEKIGNREVDALLLSIGGNDANFAPIIFAGIFQEPTHLPLSPTFTRLDQAALGINGFCTLTYFFSNKCFGFFDKASTFGVGAPGLQLFNDGIAKLAPAYTALNDSIKTTFPNLAPTRIYLTEYPNATEDEHGNACGPRLDRLPNIVDIPGWSTIEWSWAGGTVIPTLNQQGRDAATGHGWTPVPGVFAGFEHHGVCADDNWLNRIQDSFLRQGDGNGTVHPNRSGYAEIATHLVDSVKPALFSGTGQTPRPPRVPPVPDAGSPLALDEGSNVQLPNSSFDPGRGGTLRYQWSLSLDNPSGARLSSATATTPILFAVNDATGTVLLHVDSDIGGASATVPLIIRNVAPRIGAVTGPSGAVPTLTPVTVSAAFTDAGVLDRHTATVTWGDGATGAGTIVEANGAGQAKATHAYLREGTFTVTVAVTDDSGATATATLRVVVSGKIAQTPTDPVALCAATGLNVIVGTAGNDLLTGTAGADCIVGLDGQDTINGGGGDDIIFGGNGDDTISGGLGDDVIFGGPGQDHIHGNEGNDRLAGEDGDDVINGDAGNDTLSGGPGQDTCSGDDGDDVINGDSGDDRLDGGAGNDTLKDCVNHNTFTGGSGTNSCQGDRTGTHSSSFGSCQTVTSCSGL